MRTAGPAPAGRCSPSKRPIPGELNAYHLATLRSHGADRGDELYQAKLSLTVIIPICWYENTSGSFLISSLASLRALVGRGPNIYVSDIPSVEVAIEADSIMLFTLIHLHGIWTPFHSS